MVSDQEVADWLINKILTKAHDQKIDWADQSSYFYKDYRSPHVMISKDEVVHDEKDVKYIQYVGFYYATLEQLANENKTIQHLKHLKISQDMKWRRDYF